MYMYDWKVKGITFVFSLTHIQVLNLQVYMNMIKWSLTHVIKHACMSCMDNKQIIVHIPHEHYKNFKLLSVKGNTKHNKMEYESKL